ncbi:hypothetical protein BST95_07540 [Halioglobus japonicus]|uniref:ParA family protein n=1 Tax=Halioglobus japonicus TaxID=930805 RepID=A0AAP8ME17_9GAMM|nr:ParA family protein [Halioglobus japonicus]AQA18117.1 hypothetical protein BST95_07540 [Halioglobus japonicus]PLW86111.1 ParA family protein [Halioglobus japonicus]GHD14421.1 putative chromosome partitioning protein/ cobyrinic acid a,c-diamide synthase [Halioglobus japonicus]
MRRIAVINQKGGVGKTTTCANLAHAFAMVGHRIGRNVLAVDLDPQGHLSTTLGNDAAPAGVDALLADDLPLHDLVIQSRDGLALLGAGSRLADFEGLDAGLSGDTGLLGERLNDADTYDIVMIDCPPSSGFLGRSGIVAATEILIPVPGDYLAMVGLSSLLELLENIEAEIDRTLTKWIVVTRFDTRRNHAREVYDKLREYFPDQLLHSVITESVALTESPSFGQSIFEYKGTSRSASEYAALARELIETGQETRKTA